MQSTFVKVFDRVLRVLLHESFSYPKRWIFRDCLFRNSRANGCEILATESGAAVNLSRQIRRDETVKTYLYKARPFPLRFSTHSDSARSSSHLTLELSARRRDAFLLRRARSATGHPRRRSLRRWSHFFTPGSSPELLGAWIRVRPVDFVVHPPCSCFGSLFCKTGWTNLSLFFCFSQDFPDSLDPFAPWEISL